MKALWLCSTPLREVSIHYGRDIAVQGGWMNGAFNDLKNSDVSALSVCYPQQFVSNVEFFQEDFLSAYGFPWGGGRRGHYSLTVKAFTKILSAFAPDVIHIFGTEQEYCKAMYDAAVQVGLGDRVVVSIQGLVSEYAKFFCPDLSRDVLKKQTLSELKNSSNLMHQKMNLRRRGLNEIGLLSRVDHVMGRTEWDRANCRLINDSVVYHHCGESLRPQFYSAKPVKTFDSHNIYFSQGQKPIKSLHHLIEALPLVVKRFPDVKVFVSGTDGLRTGLLRGNTYDRYLASIVDRLGAREHLMFVGSLGADEVIATMAKCSVFVSTSSIENSPNSMGEAMMLGLPCVASYVGGVPDIAEHDREAFLYPWGDTHLLSNYIIRVFEDASLAKSLGNAGIARAREINHCRSKNKDSLLATYSSVAGR